MGRMTHCVIPAAGSDMARPPEKSVSDALFDPLPEDVKARFNLENRASGNAQSDGDHTDGTADDDQTKDPGREAARAQADAQDADILPKPRPDPPASPWGLKAKEWFGVLKTTFREIGRDRVTSVAGGVTFFGILALFPAITALVSIFGLFSDPTEIESVLDTMERFVPPSALDIIRGQIEAIIQAPGTALSLAGIFGLLATLWSANGGMKALLDALNVAGYQTEGRGFIKLNLVSLGMTLGAIVLLMAMMAAIAVIPLLLSWLPIPEGIESTVKLVRWPIMFVVLMGALAALYRWGPSGIEGKFQFFSPGALFASVGLVAASALFSWYAANFANYNETYGSIGAVIALMMWLWVACIVVMVGAELNSEASRHVRALRGKSPSPPAT